MKKLRPEFSLSCDPTPPSVSIWPFPAPPAGRGLFFRRGVLGDAADRNLNPLLTASSAVLLAQAENSGICLNGKRPMVDTRQHMACEQIALSDMRIA